MENASLAEQKEKIISAIGQFQEVISAQGLLGSNLHAGASEPTILSNDDQVTVVLDLN